MKNGQKVISHGILPLLPQNLTINFRNIKELSVGVESPYFQTFSSKRCNNKIVQGDGHGKSKPNHGKAYFFQV